MIKEFVYRKKLELYQAQYAELCNRRTQLYSSIGYEQPQVSIEEAENFLLALKIFNKKVPRRVIRERFDDFRDAKDLALVVLK